MLKRSHFILYDIVSWSMDQWMLSLTSTGEGHGDVYVKRGIFQGDSLPPLLLALTIIPIFLILRKVNAC